MSITVIGDVHGQHNKYIKLIQAYPYTLQLGDFGFRYDILDQVDKNHHRVLRGNHDNYDLYHPNLLDDFGIETLGGVEFYYVRGAYSIDKQARLSYEQQTIRNTWWEEEELSYAQGLKCLEFYEQTKPEIVCSHSCPASISEVVGDTRTLLAFGFPADWCSNTQHLLQAMLDIHKPSLWLFGHFHRNWNQIIDGVEYRCLNELSTFTIEGN